MKQALKEKGEIRDRASLSSLKYYKALVSGKGYKESTVLKRIKIIKKYLLWLGDMGIGFSEAEAVHAKRYLKTAGLRLRSATVEEKRYILSLFYESLKDKDRSIKNIFSRECVYPEKRKPGIILEKDQERVITEFISKVKLKRKIIEHDRSNVRQYLGYLNDHGIEYAGVKVGEAEGYRRYLFTLRDDKGRVKYNPGTVTNKTGSVAVFYDYLISSGRTAFNPFKELSPVRERKSLPGNIPGEKKLTILLKGLKDKITKGGNVFEKRRYYRWHVIAELMYSTGARINEVLKLKREDFDLEKGTVKLRDDKTGKERAGFLNGYASEIINIYFEIREMLLAGKSRRDMLFGGRPSVMKAFNRDTNKLSKELGLGRFTSHNLRHCFGYHMLRAGCDIRYIQGFLGHERLGTTQIYTKIDKRDLKAVLDKYHPRAMKARSGLNREKLKERTEKEVSDISITRDRPGKIKQSK